MILKIRDINFRNLKWNFKKENKKNGKAITVKKKLKKTRSRLRKRPRKK